MNTILVRLAGRIALGITLLLLIALRAGAQQPHKKTKLKRIDLKKIETQIQKDSVLLKKYQDLSFYYNQKYVPRVEAQKKETLKFEAYLDTYYAWYSDSAGIDQYQKFPTSSPKANQFGLNMLMASVKYEHQKVRGTIVLHYGDIASSAWSTNFNLIQEAHVGLRLMKKVWIDAGFFRTHLGFESIQCRENLTTSVATTTYYEPYFLSGGKIYWYATPKLTFMGAAFNGFNTFVETNKYKTLGFSANYDFSDHCFLSFNSLYGNEVPDGFSSKIRSYNDLYFGYKSDRLDIGGEVNYGVQTKSKLADSSATANMYSALAAIKYKMFDQQFAIYARGEYFNDPDEILTGPIQNEFHKLVGLNIWGVTAGIEFKPIPNSFIRIEHRTLQTLGSDEKVFNTNSKYINQRLEFIGSMGVWF